MIMRTIAPVFNLRCSVRVIGFGASEILMKYSEASSHFGHFGAFIWTSGGMFRLTLLRILLIFEHYDRRYDHRDHRKEFTTTQRNTPIGKFFLISAYF
jgi:hypothetical protein